MLPVVGQTSILVRIPPMEIVVALLDSGKLSPSPMFPVKTHSES